MEAETLTRKTPYKGGSSSIGSQKNGKRVGWTEKEGEEEKQLVTVFLRMHVYTTTTY